MPLHGQARFLSFFQRQFSDKLPIGFRARVDKHSIRSAHSDGIGDFQGMIERLHKILNAANRVGIGAGLTSLANEAYHNSPEELRAVPTKLGHYYVDSFFLFHHGADLPLQIYSIFSS